MGRPERKKIAEILKEEGLITDEQVRQAIAMQARTDKRLGEILVDLGFVNERELADALARQYGYRRVYLQDAAVDRAMLELVPRDLLERYDVFPVALDGPRIILAMADPIDVVAQDDVEMARAPRGGAGRRGVGRNSPRHRSALRRRRRLGRVRTWQRNERARA